SHHHLISRPGGKRWAKPGLSVLRPSTDDDGCDPPLRNVLSPTHGGKISHTSGGRKTVYRYLTRFGLTPRPKDGTDHDGQNRSTDGRRAEEPGPKKEVHSF